MKTVNGETSLLWMLLKSRSHYLLITAVIYQISNAVIWTCQRQLARAMQSRRAREKNYISENFEDYEENSKCIFEVSSPGMLFFGIPWYPIKYISD